MTTRLDKIILFPLACWIIVEKLLFSAVAMAVTAMVSWNPSPESDVVKYRLYRANGSPCSTNSALLAEVLAPNTTYVDQGIDSTKHYCVTAVDAVGQESVVSAEVTATYPSSAPVNCN